MSSITEGLELLFDRPGETLLTPKGEKNSSAVFLMKKEFLPKDYENNGLEINSRYGDEEGIKTIPVQGLRQLPRFRTANQLPVDADFSLFLPAHQEMADELLDILMSVPENNLQEYLSTCVFARMNLNPQLFNYCYSVSLMHRHDTRNIKVKNYAETFPSKFIDSRAFAQARQMSAVAQITDPRVMQGSQTPAVPSQTVPRIPIVIPRDYTATNLDIEHRLAYFREDIGINLHHWHWHLVYPFSAKDRSIVAKDRRGELFYYMHQQIIARYNNERLNNAMARVKKLSNWRDPIPEAYFPKLDSLTSSRGWPPRQANMRWQDLDRPADKLKIKIADMERWRNNVDEAIATGIVQKVDGSTQPLDIDTLGNMLEASILSPNPDLYGALHNNGHSFCAYMHDPNHRYLESFGIIADEGTTMRDPLFYRWHAFIDDLFQRHKESPHVRAYARSELENDGVRIISASVESSTGEKNVMNTFWTQSDIDMSRGLDFSDRGPIYVRITHLNHRPFRYVVNVNNTGSARRTTVRIFIAPKYDERSLEWMFTDQRKMFIEMDRFVVPLTRGQNTITRSSSQSSVTIPFEQTFRDLRLAKSSMSATSFNYCGCGWPQHMLVPRGTEAGAAYQLFVMLSNYDQDRIDQPDGSELSCVEASSFCGLKDKKYPDKRPMGFPFDRPSRTASSIQDFILPNMALTDITIRLQNVTEKNPRNVAK